MAIFDALKKSLTGVKASDVVNFIQSKVPQQITENKYYKAPTEESKQKVNKVLKAAAELGKVAAYNPIMNPSMIVEPKLKELGVPSSLAFAIGLGLDVIAPGPGEISKATKKVKEGAELLAKGTSKISKEVMEKTIKKEGTKLIKKDGTKLTEQLPIKPTIEESIGKVSTAVKEAKTLTKEQKLLYSEEKGGRLASGVAKEKSIGGEAGFYAKLGELKGELPKIEFESIKSKVSQDDVDNLFNAIKDSQLDEFEKVSAGNGLAKMFEGQLPTDSELRVMSFVYPDKFIKEMLSKQDLFSKFKNAGLELANLPRSLMATADMSAPFRQGIFLGARNPKEFTKAFGQQFKYFFSEKAFNESQEAIAKHPNYPLAKEGKLSLTNVSNVLSQREERFMSSWADKIPLIGSVTKASSRAYTGFLNKLRFDVYNKLVDDAQKVGRNPVSDLYLNRQIANFVNTATGRGSFKALEQAAPVLNSLLFSPKLMYSRLSLLNPVYYAKLDPFVRKEALKSLFAFTGSIMTVLGLSKLAGAEVETDIRSSDFGKVKIGNTRIDVMGGFQQYIRMAGQLITGEYVSSTTGKEFTLGEGYKPLTRGGILLRQIESKEAPVLSFVTDLLRGQDYSGEPISITSEIGQRFIPMVAKDLVELAQEDPKLIPLGALGFFGFGLQTYPNASTGFKVKNYTNSSSGFKVKNYSK
jgi:TusA-related sulfurtransferase